MALRPNLSSRVNATLEITTATVRFSPVEPPRVEVVGRLQTKDRRTGEFSTVRIDLQHLPPSGVAFFADLKAALAGAGEK